ncbi:hypothetical protein FGO68_gene2889 [Halteria grandinella]|uniref:Uncharacterized protein n=1 Tax=Halteria grandinella TaxID=5974 RepID=A0A8J8SUE6_HALGN|nr:hypothetical protein FGO68_gene2889 [Halteria grandinella]
MSPSSGAKPENTSGPVGVCAALPFPKATSRARGAKSSAAPEAFAAAVASARIASISLSSTLVRVTAPDAIEPAIATNEITVTLRCWITPFVVRVLLAQRRLACVLSWTTTMQSSVVERARIFSTRS